MKATKATLLLILALAPHVCTRAQTQRRTRASLTTAAKSNSADRPRADSQARSAQTLPIRRVILYSNGVAYIERRGTVTGRAEIDLSFKQSQVDDVLKSMVVLDLGRGRIGAVSYNSSAPPAARMADIPFSISAATAGGASGGLAGVLGQLQGARVSVTTAAGKTFTGSILTVEERRTQGDPSRPQAVTQSLVIASDGGELSSFDLSDVRAVRLLDEGARRDLGEFASATASARRRDAKTITVTSDGSGAREMVVSYTVAAPIWKTTYRVVLDDKGEPFFQGWAVVDNVSDEDWTDIRLSLISGTPVSFIQPIQKPFYRYRPVIPVPDDLRLSPQTYEPDTGESGGNTISGRVEDPQDAAVPGATVTVTDAATGKVAVTVNTNDEGRFRTPYLPPGNYTVKVDARGFRSFVSSDVRVTATRPASLDVELEVGGAMESVTVTASGGAAQEVVNSSSSYIVDGVSVNGLRQLNLTVSEAMTSGNSGVEAAAQGGEIGDLFEYRIEQPVTVRRDRSALIPILQTRMEGPRVSVFRESDGRQRPMSGLMLKNTSPLTLEGGALTVIDGDAYAGEALLERLKPKEERLVSFALDLGTLITVRGEIDNAPVHTVRIVNGTLYANRYHREKKVYTLRNQTERARTVYVEHPFREGWQLDGKLTPTPDGRTRTSYRFRVELGPNETRDFVVSERENGAETYALSNVTPDLIQLFVTRRYIDEATRRALENILDIKARLARANARAEAVEKEMAEIAADQKRLRENIEALNSTAEARQLITRYVQKADQQETRLEQLTKDKQTLLDERASLQTQLDSALRTLALDRDLAEK
ncbi:MAG TPA: carboxypeptidase regulatory-like domain-containing protein [Pyrinomonadaceae bacterium]|jgi:hypothetical protein|nr:carboxypeptidase regulatory-like domain-containing protein [Pyrinomonadaceae bacterium]